MQNCRGYRYYLYLPTPHAQDALYAPRSYRIGHRIIAMLAGRSRHRIYSPFWFETRLEWRCSDGDKRPRARPQIRLDAFTYVCTYIYVRFPEILVRESRLSSLNPHSYVRENIARLMISVTREGEGARRPPACLPGCQAARLPGSRLPTAAASGCSTERERRVAAAKLRQIASPLFSHGTLSVFLCRATKKNPDEAYETIDPISRIPRRKVPPFLL